MRIEKAKIRYPAERSQEQRNSGSNRSSSFTARHKGEFYNLAVNKLFPFHKQARKHFDENALNKMAETIKAHGIRQPLTVIPMTNRPGEYEVVSGERRLKAAKIAGLELVPCIIIHDQQAAFEIALIENIQREDLHPIELARAYKQLLDDGICSSKVAIAEKLGIAKSSVTEIINLLSMPEEIQSILVEKNISTRNVFRELLHYQTAQEMKDYLSAYVPKSTIKKKVIFKIIKIGESLVVEQAISKEKSPLAKKEIKERILTILESL